MLTSHAVIVTHAQNIMREATERVLISESPRSQAHNQSQSLDSSREEDETTDTTAPADRRTISASIERLTWLPRFIAFKKLSSPIPIAGTGPAVDSAAQERTLPRSSACQPGRPRGHLQLRTDRNPIAPFDVVSVMKQWL